VTVVNGGDLGKEADLYPPAATTPEPSWSELAIMPGSDVRLPAADVATLRSVVERARPAVVELTDVVQGLGSGIIVDSSGVSLTNNHVVSALQRDKTVAILADGRRFPVRQLGADEWTDVAVVRIDAPDLPSVPLGRADSLAVGDRVVGIGYAPAFPGGPTARTGTVSDLSGKIQTYQDYPLFNLITTDTFLHPGDSGGPLLNMRGEVVGINSAIRVPRPGRNFAGYSIPIEGARAIADQIVATGQVPRPQIGVNVQDVTPVLSGSLGLPVRQGVLIMQVTPGSPAEQAGLQEGDVIVGMDNLVVSGITDLRRLMVNHKVGDRVPFAVVGAGRPQRTLTVTLIEGATAA
jgi:S1-C subfamily serine protease